MKTLSLRIATAVLEGLIIATPVHAVTVPHSAPSEAFQYVNRPCEYYGALAYQIASARDSGRSLHVELGINDLVYRNHMQSKTWWELTKDLTFKIYKHPRLSPAESKTQALQSCHVVPGPGHAAVKLPHSAPPGSGLLINKPCEYYGALAYQIASARDGGRPLDAEIGGDDLLYQNHMLSKTWWKLTRDLTFRIYKHPELSPSTLRAQTQESCTRN
jgi:hypothetical protein